MSGVTAGEGGALHGDERNDPGEESDQGAEGEEEDGENGFGAAEAALGQVSHDRVEQVSEDGRDRDRDKDRLEESNQVGAEIDDRTDDEKEDDDKDRGERGPHRFALPRCRILFHLIGVGPATSPLLSLVLAAAIFPASLLFSLSSASDFCQNSIAFLACSRAA